MTRSLRTLPLLSAALLLGAGLPALAQEACEARTLSHLDGVGASTSLSVVKQGDAWQIELEKVTLADERGVASEQRVVVLVKSDHTVDEGLDALFREAPDDPVEWERRIEEIAHIQLDLARPDPALTEPLFERPRRRRPERWFDDLREQWRARERQWKDEVRRWRPDEDAATAGATATSARATGRTAPREGKLYY